MKRILLTLIVFTCFSGAMWAETFTATTAEGYVLTYEINEGGTTVTCKGLVDKNTAGAADLVIPETVTNGSITYTVTSIGYPAFCDCDGFTGSLTIGNGVTTVDGWAFYRSDGFAGTLTIGKGLGNVSNLPLSADGFTEFIVHADNPNYSAADGILYNKDKTTITQCPKSKTGTLTIPAGVTSIGFRAFYGCSGLTGTLTIPEGVLIGDGAFWGCSGFTGPLTIPAGLTSIENYAFSGCDGFTGTLTIPAGVTRIGENAFSGCKGFTGTLTIGNDVTSIESYAFSGCDGLTGTLTIPAGVTRIGENAFSGCKGFTGSLIIPDGVTKIGDGAFCDCNGFTGALTIGNGVTSIGGWTFRGADSFTGTLTIGKGLRDVSGLPLSADGFTEFIVHEDNLHYSSADGILYNKDKTTIIRCLKGKTGSLIIPDGVTSIGENAFESCSGLTGTLTIGDNVTTIGDGAFRYCYGFTGALTIGKGLGDLSNLPLSADGFTEFIVHEDNANYSSEDGVLYNKDKTTIILCPKGKTGTLTIPNSVTSIGADAFAGDRWNPMGITCIKSWATTPPSASVFAFDCINSNTYVIVPDAAAAEAYKEATGWDRFTNYVYGDLYTITYHANGGEGTTATQMVRQGESITLAYNAFRCDNAAFFGWDTDSLANVATYNQGDEFTPTADITLYAVWKINNFTATTAEGYELKYEVNEDNTTVTCTGIVDKNTAGAANLVIPATVTKDKNYDVTSIGYYAFNDCSGFTGSLTIGDNVKNIVSSAFQNCSGFTGPLTIPDSVTNIGNDAFNGCSGFTKVVFDGCKDLTIVNNSFPGANVDTIHFTEQVSGMGFSRNAFGYEPKVSTILYDAVDWGEKADGIFGENNLRGSVTKIIIGTSVQRIPSGIFQYFDKVAEVELHDGITYIGENAFSPKTAMNNMPTIPLADAFTPIKGVFPTSTGHFYDLDADGQMDVIGEVEKESIKIEDPSYSYYVHNYTLPIATNTGLRKGNILLGESLDYSDERVSLTIDNVDRKGAAEVLIQNDNNNGFEWLLYDVTSGNLKQQFKMPTIGGNTQSLAFDANGDGRTDYFCGHTPADSWDGDINSFIAYQQADGSFLSQEVQIITDKDEIGEAAFAQYEPHPGAPSSIVFTGVSLAKAPRLQKVAAATDAPQKQIASEMFEGGEPQAIDLNMDGLLDIVNLQNGNCLLSLGNEKYYYGTMDGEVTAKDLTGDGVPDYVIYNEETKKVTLQIYKGNGEFEDKLLYQNLGISGIHCYDFDKDEDVDILLTFDYDAGVGMAATFCAFFENEDNNFKKRERAIMNRKLYFKELKDYDNDGQYELVALESDKVLDTEVTDDEIYYDCEMFYTIKCKSDFSVEVSAKPFGAFGGLSDWRDNIRDFSLFSVDADSDGYLETWIEDAGIVDKGSVLEGEYKFYDYTNGNVQGRIFNTAPNTAPEKMSTPRAIFDNTNNVLRLEWDKGVDAQQSSADLTYAIRIGTASGAGDIVYAHADATGRRLRPGEGNAAYNLYKYYMTEAWNAGTYYIAIQAIDNNGAGGAWSDELVYELTTETSDFALSATQITVNDTLLLQPKTTFNPAYTYDWDFGADATLVKNKLGVWQVQYSTIGNKTITLQVTTPTGTLESHSDEVFVSGMNLEIRNFKGELTDEGDFPNLYRSGSFVDLDMDGHLDLLGHYRTNNSGNGIYGVLESNADGTFTKFGSLYNMDITWGSTTPDWSKSRFVLDLNMDGHPDFLAQESGKANGSNWFINDEDLYFSDEKKTFVFPNCSETNLYDEYGHGTRADFNNDGYEDFYFCLSYHGANIALNQGDNFTFKQASEEYDGIFGNTEETIKTARDMNNDGWVDLITQDEAGDHVKRYIRWNNGDMTFNEKTEITVHGDIWNDSYWEKRMTDFNNDGYLDMIYKQYEDPYDHWGSNSRIVIYLGDETYSYSNPIYLTDYKDNFYLSDAEISSVDFDNNGYLDILVTKDGQYGINGILYLFEGWKTEFVRVTDVAAVEKYYDISTSLFADLNGDGTPDMTNADMISTLPNERPAAPTGVRATVGNKGMNLSWSVAMDKETPSAQMRYNISLKIKGESGEDSYILSPLNNGVDYIAPVSSKEYLRGLTSYTVPFSRFVSGTEYELKVQAFDLWNSASAFSETFTFTMSDDLFITGADKACVGNGVILTVSGNNAEGGGTPVWNLGDDATIVETDGNSVEVLWDNPGLKEVSVTMNGKEGKGAVMVHETLDLEFDLPNTILSGGYVYFTLPEAFLDASNQVKIRTSFDAEPFSIGQGEFASVGGVMEMIPSIAVANTNGMSIERRGATLEARILVNADDDDYWMEFVAEDKNCGSVSYRQSFNVQGKNITPQISVVTVDAATGKNKIMWNEPTDLDTQSGVYDKIVVFKEMGATENFVAIAEVAIAEGEFVDPSSDPYLRKGRYRIALGTSYGGVSNPSTTHASVHVMLNKGVTPNSVNIVWTPYEGAVIDQYTILRGSDPNNLQVLTTASGYETSYTDMTMPAGDVYYALQYTNTYDTQWNPMNGPAHSGMMKVSATSTVATGVSNAVNANAASTVSLAESIQINHVQPDAELTPAQSTLLLYTEILPAQASYKQANWRITEGSDLATITQDGMLVYSGNGKNGTVVVRATTLDGSGLSDDITIMVKDFVSSALVTGIIIDAVDDLTPTNPSVQLVATVVPDNATEQDVDWSISQGDDIVSLTSGGLVTATGINGSATIRATAQDESGIFSEITITVTGFTSALEDSEIDQVKILTQDNRAYVMGAKGKSIRVFNISGLLIQAVNQATSKQEFVLPQEGVYLFVVDDKPIKVML